MVNRRISSSFPKGYHSAMLLNGAIIELLNTDVVFKGYYAWQIFKKWFVGKRHFFQLQHRILKQSIYQGTLSKVYRRSTSGLSKSIANFYCQENINIFIEFKVHLIHSKQVQLLYNTVIRKFWSPFSFLRGIRSNFFHLIFR